MGFRLGDKVQHKALNLLDLTIIEEPTPKKNSVACEFIKNGVKHQIQLSLWNLSRKDNQS